MGYLVKIKDFREIKEDLKEFIKTDKQMLKTKYGIVYDEELFYSSETTEEQLLALSYKNLELLEFVKRFEKEIKELEKENLKLLKKLWKCKK